MIEGSGSIPLTNGSGSGKLKNMWIRWIRIRNTDLQILLHAVPHSCGAAEVRIGTVPTEISSYQEIVQLD
jgi:hypothetical protein